MCPCGAVRLTTEEYMLTYFDSARIRLLVLTMAITLTASSAFGDTYIVTNPDPGAFPTPPGTLRHAIEQAQANPGPDIIFFDLVGPCPCEITVGHPDFNISTELIIDGGNQVALKAQSLLSLFIVQSSGNLTLRNLEMFANVSPSESAVRNNGTVVIENSTIRRFFGSGLKNGGQMTIVNSTVTGNQTIDVTVAPNGGGIDNTSTLTVINSTISGNEAIGHGGGIYNTGTLTVRNSTIAGNRSNAPGGGTSSLFENGGGIYSGGAETLHNSIVIGNLVGTGSGEPDFSDDINGGVVESYSNMLVGNPGSAGQMIDGVNDSIIGSSNGTQLLPMGEVIATLADNGGPTKTHAFVAESPAIDAGSDALAVGADGVTPLATDQRGPGFPRKIGSSVDIGAWEGEPNVAPEIVNLSANGPVNEGETVTLTGTVNDGNAADQFGGIIDWGDGTSDTVSDLGVGEFQFTHTYADSGVYTIEITINDVGFFASASTDVTVNNVGPLVSNVTTAPASPLTVGTQFQLTGNVSDPGGDLMSDIEINWGDGTIEHPIANPALTAFAFPHTYAVAGEYVITITFTDDEGAETSTTLAVSAALPSPPAAPTLLRVDSISMDRLTVQWTDNSDNEDGFAVESCRNKGCTVYRELARVGPNVNTYTDLDLLPNTQYYYRVRAFNLGGFSDYSNKVTGKTLRK